MVNRILAFIKKIEFQLFYKKYGDLVHFNVIYRAAKYNAKVVFSFFLNRHKLELSFFNVYLILGKAQIVQATKLSDEDMKELKIMEENGEL